MYTCQEQDARRFGIEWNAPDAEAVELPAMNNPLTLSDYSNLCEQVDPRAPSETYGLDLYHLAVQFVENTCVRPLAILYIVKSSFDAIYTLYKCRKMKTTQTVSCIICLHVL